MGNCLGVKEQVVRVMAMDGKVLEYRSPVKVNEVLSQFKDYGVSETFPVSKFMHRNAELVTGCLYYLMPLQKVQSSEQGKKKVRFSVPEVEGGGSSRLRVKLVISKQKLKEIIEGGAVSIDGIVSEMQKEEAENTSLGSAADCPRKSLWKPALNTIIEAD